MRLSVSVRGSWPARTPPWSQRTVTWQEAFGTTPRHDALRQDALGHDAFGTMAVRSMCAECRERLTRRRPALEALRGGEKP